MQRIDTARFGRYLLAILLALAMAGRALTSAIGTDVAVDPATRHESGHLPTHPNDSECVDTISAAIGSLSARMCDTIAVHFAVTTSCPLRPLHVVIVQPLHALEADWMIDVSRRIIANLDTAATSLRPLIGVISYDSGGAQVSLDMSDDFAKARRVTSQPAFGGASHDLQNVLAASRAVALLESVRAGTSPLPFEVIVFFGFSKPTDRAEAQNLEQAGLLMNRSGAVLLAGCPNDLGQDWCTYIRRMVTDNANYGEPSRRAALPDRFKVLLGELFDGVGDVTAADVTHTIPASVRLLAGSAAPPPEERPLPGGETDLIWRLVPVDAGSAYTVSYQLEPLAPGPVVITSTFVITDFLGQTSTRPDTLGPVVIYEGCPTSTPATASSPTPSPTATPDSTATTTPMTEPIYLPIALAEHCTPETSYADTVLVLDASTSMLEEIRPGYTKRDAAVDAAGRFVELMKSADQAAVVYFNDTVVLEQALTGDKSALHAALGRIVNRQFTRLDLGIKFAAQELSGDRRDPGHRAVIILLTDGKANPEPAATAIEEARLTKAAGILLFVIGLGRPEDLDDDALRQIASRPDYYFRTSDATALRAIYEQIAGVIPCPPEQFWGRRLAADGVEPAAGK